MKHRTMVVLPLKHKETQACLLLLLASAIWGFAFVAQRVGSRYIASFAFNGIRFALGAVSLLPLLLFSRRKQKAKPETPARAKPGDIIFAGVISGLVLFTAASLQQIGVVTTSAGKAGFITGLYIVLVPIIGIFLGQRAHPFVWAGVAAAVAGLYLICVSGSFAVSKGDLYVLICSLFWAVHIHLIDRFTKRIGVLELSICQFLTCSALSVAASLLFETVTLSDVLHAAVPILYGGLCSVGIAYTLQAAGQKYAPPAHSAIILSMESLFSAVGGFLILGENLGLRAYIGCALMVGAILLSQYPLISGAAKRKNIS